MTSCTVSIISLLFLSACATAGAAAPAGAATIDACPAVPEARPSAAGIAEVQKVDGATAKKLVAEGARLVDVRAPEFYAREHIAGALNIPVAQIADRAAAAIGPCTTAVVLYCRTGAGSAKAAATLARMGYTRIYDLGSYLNWGEGAPAPTPLPPKS